MPCIVLITVADHVTAGVLGSFSAQLGRQDIDAPCHQLPPSDASEQRLEAATCSTHCSRSDRRGLHQDHAAAFRITSGYVPAGTPHPPVMLVSSDAGITLYILFKLYNSQQLQSLVT
jgi:hypothetical protein